MSAPHRLQFVNVNARPPYPRHPRKPRQRRSRSGRLPGRPFRIRARSVGRRRKIVVRHCYGDARHRDRCRTGPQESQRRCCARAARGKDVVDQNNVPARDPCRLNAEEGAPHVALPLCRRKAGLLRRFFTTHEHGPEVLPAQHGSGRIGQERCLVVPPLTQAPAVQRNGHNDRSGADTPAPEGHPEQAA